MANKKQVEHRPVSNRPMYDAMMEIRRSGAAGTHGDRRTKRNRSRSAQKQNAIKNQND